MKTLLLTVAALFIYDAARIVLIATIRFIKALTLAKKGEKMNQAIDALPFLKRVQLKNILKKKEKQN